MNERISRLCERTMSGAMYAEPIEPKFDRLDAFLPRMQREAKQLREYILAQEPVLTEDSMMTGAIHFTDAVVGDAFHRRGHAAFGAFREDFYCKPIDNLSTFEWQHAAADFSRILNKGISGIIADIHASMACHNEHEQLEFLRALETTAQALIEWAHKCSARARTLCEKVESKDAQRRLTTLADALLRVPEHRPQSFYEAVLSIYVCFSTDPDSLGPIDRQLWPFYEHDVLGGSITKDEAKEYLQELFLMIQAYTPTSFGFTRGGQSHFSIGGYLADGSDGFTELSQLILDAMIDLPIYLPQVTLRWTQKTPREVLYTCMDYERKDPHKRIAFTNDEKRIRAFTTICNIPYEKAVGYTMIGCNEPSFTGAITGANSNINIAKSIEILFHQKSDIIEKCQSFDEFYLHFEREMRDVYASGLNFDDLYNLVRSRDYNYITSLVFNDCIENARSLTQGGGNTVICSPMVNGITNVIDSLIIIKQFVFDEKICSMRELIDAVQNDFLGYESLHLRIRKQGDFFGNDTERSNQMAQRFYHSVYLFLKDRKNVFGYPILVGDLCGEHEHNKIFGSQMKALPDGRRAGAPIKYGFGQTEGRDRNGLSAYLNSIAKADPDAIVTGSTVTNVMLDENLIRNDAYFEKIVELFETYFRLGGVHFQLSYVSREDLLKARANPEEYGNLRVRVSGFSEYFVILEEGLQDDVIARTTQKM